MKHAREVMGPDFYVPAPGRVQYYRAEALPFVPDEVKNQLRFPKAYAMSFANLRYLDAVRQETERFLEQNISENYFTGEATVPLTATLAEAEVLYSAGDAVRDLASSGQLSGLHQRCADLSDSSERLYVATRDRLQNVLQAAQAKEDDIYESLREDHELSAIRMHDVYGASLADLVAWAKGGVTVDNLAVLSRAIPDHDDATALTAHQVKLQALLSVKASALASLVALQHGYVHNVNGDAAARDDLSRLEATHDQYKTAA